MNVLAKVGVLSAILSLGAGVTVAQSEFKLVPSFEPGEQVDLDITPSKVELRDQQAFIMGIDDDGDHVLQLRDAITLEPVTAVKLEMEADDVITDLINGSVYVIGHVGGATLVKSYDEKLNQIGELEMPRLVAYPKLSISPNGFLVIGSLQADFSDGFFGVISVQDPARPQYERIVRAPEAWRGVLGVWVDAESLTLFMNAAWDTRLIAMTLTTEEVLSEFSEVTERAREPYVIFALMGHLQCRNGKGSSFLVADMDRSTLSMVDYIAFFESLSMRGSGRFSLAPSRATVRDLPGTKLRQQVGVLSASCDQSVVLIGSRTSFEVDQFARNTELKTLEQVGSIILPFVPTDIDVSQDGRFALAISERGRKMLRLSDQTGSAETRVGRIDGDPHVRELQRVLTEAGLPVGSIDGIIGPKTLLALDIAAQRYDIELNPKADLAATLETLKQAISARSNSKSKY